MAGACSRSGQNRQQQRGEGAWRRSPMKPNLLKGSREKKEEDAAVARRRSHAPPDNNAAAADEEEGEGLTYFEEDRRSSINCAAEGRATRNSGLCKSYSSGIHVEWFKSSWSVSPSFCLKT